MTVLTDYRKNVIPDNVILTKEPKAKGQQLSIHRPVARYAACKNWRLSCYGSAHMCFVSYNWSSVCSVNSIDIDPIEEAITAVQNKPGLTRLFVLLPGMAAAGRSRHNALPDQDCGGCGGLKRGKPFQNSVRRRMQLPPQRRRNKMGTRRGAFIRSQQQQAQHGAGASGAVGPLQLSVTFSD